MVITAPVAGAQVLFTGNDRVGGNAETGFEVYRQSCVICHGAQLEGGPAGPTLVGEAFQNKWRGEQAAQLLTLLRETMPPKGTFTVPPEAYPNLLAFLVRANVQGVPEGGVGPAGPRAAPVQIAIANPLPAPLMRRLQALTPVSEAMLSAPPPADWLMWRRTFDVAGFSPLRQIDRDNVGKLQTAWSLALPSSTNEIAPLIHDGVLFVNSGGVVVAIDGASGVPLWKYETRAVAEGTSNAFDRMKSMALLEHRLYVPTSDGHMVALDTRSGAVLWDREIRGIAPGSGLNLSSGPLVARGVVMIGVSLGLNNAGGCFIVGLDATTGEERWRFHTVAAPGTIGGDTWNDAPANERFGGGVWTIGSYDPDLQLAYFGVGNTYTISTLLQPRPGASGTTRNDGLFTDATLALRPQTGELVWHHQHHHRDVWDQDWAFEQTVVTLGSGADARRAVVTGGKTGIFEAVDAATGEFLFAHDTGFTNLFLNVDEKTGDKQPNPAMEPVPGKQLLLCPSNFGARNWPATSFDQASGTLFVPMLESCADYTYELRSARQSARGGTDMRFTPRPRPDGDGNLGRIMALDLNTRSVRWTHRQRAPLAGSVLATAGGVLFATDLARNLAAFDQTSGELLWRTQLPAAAESTPVTYEVDGRQYIAMVAGEGSRLGLMNRRLDESLGEPRPDVRLVVFALPEQ